MLGPPNKQNFQTTPFGPFQPAPFASVAVAAPAPIRHTFAISETAPEVVCHCACGHHAEPTWHEFACVCYWCDGVLTAGMACPSCAVNPGLDDVIRDAIVKAVNAAHRTN